MNIYELIEHSVKIGLLTVDVAYALRFYLQKDNKQSQNEENLQKVIEEAISYFEKQSNNDDCLVPFSNINLLDQFLATTEHIYNSSIKELCNHIMAHEFASPGVTPQRIMQILSIISFEDMQKFQIICSMNIGIITNYNNDSDSNPIAKKHVMVPFKDTNEHSEKIDIYLDDIHELQAIGLIMYNSRGYYISGVPCKHPLIYANGKTLYVLWHHKDEIPMGNILLTKAGECLFNVINECEIANGYDVDVREFMESFGVAFAEQDMYSVFKADGIYTLTAKKRNKNYNS